MKFLADTYKKTGKIHHAYAFEGKKEALLADLLVFLNKDFGVEVKNNPDFLLQEFETFAIDDSRALREIHGRRALSGKKIFIISTRFITSEAQNSLLKIFEEPSDNAHFFLIMPNTQVLIPTLRSRLVVANYVGLGNDLSHDILSGEEASRNDLAKKFLSASVAERLALIKNIVEEKDKGKAIDFVTALEKTLASNLKPKDADALAEILMVKKYLYDRAPSIKLLLEHLCLFVTMSKS